MLDHYLWGSCDRISPEAPVQVITREKSTYSLGGAGNVAVNAHNLGARISLASVIGVDQNTERLQALIRESKISGLFLLSDNSRKVTEKKRVMANGQQVVRIDNETTFDISETTEKKLLATIIDSMDSLSAIIISDYAKGVMTEALTKDIIHLSRKKEIPVLCDPKGSNFNKYRGATVITPNKKETSQATGISIVDDNSLYEAGRLFCSELNLDFCTITLSEDGMAIFNETLEQKIPANSQAVYDVTGAGDTVIAAMAVALAQDLTYLEACKFANAAAGIAVTKAGVSPVTLNEVKNSLNAQPNSKIRTIDELENEICTLKLMDKKITFTNGCFDIFHAGHLNSLETASKFGDFLVVGLNSDRSIKNLKGPGRPINSLLNRASILCGLSCVDRVVIFDDDTPIEIIDRIVPHTIVKGGDYRAEEIVGAKTVLDNGGDVRVIPLVPGLSSSAIIEQANLIEDFKK